jgi:predicted DNA-binding ribbon-helix-helix protein
MPVKPVRGSKRKRFRRRSKVVKRAIHVFGRSTGVSLEDAFWDAMQKIAMAKGTTRARLIAHIKKKRKPANLSSAIRLFVLEYYKAHGDETSTSNRPAKNARRYALIRAVAGLDQGQKPGRRPRLG